MLEIVPMTLKEANAFVEQNHRHHGPVVGHKFSIGLSDGEKIVGVAIVGRPVARHLDDGWTLEVNRLCTDGTRNACSIHSDGHTVHEFDQRFQLEDEGFLSADDKTFRWSMLDEALNYRLF